jgi:hypothetical protein
MNLVAPQPVSKDDDAESPFLKVTKLYTLFFHSQNVGSLIQMLSSAPADSYHEPTRREPGEWVPCPNAGEFPFSANSASSLGTKSPGPPPCEPYHQSNSMLKANKLSPKPCWTWLVLLGLPSIVNSSGLELMARLERSGEKLRHYLRDSNGRLDKQTGKGAIQPYLDSCLRPQVTHAAVNMYV